MLDPMARVTNCQGSVGSVLTHVDNTSKVRVEGVWLPPALASAPAPSQLSNEGAVEFYATVVQGFRGRIGLASRANPIFPGQHEATASQPAFAADLPLVNLTSAAPDLNKTLCSAGCLSKLFGFNLVLLSLAMAFN